MFKYTGAGYYATRDGRIALVGLHPVGDRRLLTGIIIDDLPHDMGNHGFFDHDEHDPRQYQRQAAWNTDGTYHLSHNPGMKPELDLIGRWKDAA